MEKTNNRDANLQLAAERTLLAWVRTGLAMMGFGFVVARFGLFLREIAAVRNDLPHGSHGGSLWIGVCLVCLGVWVLAVSSLRYRTYTRAVIEGRQVAPPGPKFLVGVALLLAVAGVSMAVYLIWVA